MDPFDLPPSTPPVSLEPVEPRRPSRGRTALVALAAAGLVGGGIVGVSALVSADRPSVEGDGASLAAVADDDPIDESDEPFPDAPEPDGPEPDDGAEPDDPARPVIDGEIVIDTGDGDPLVLDLGELTGDDGVLACLPHLDMTFGDLDDFPFEDLPFGDLERFPEGFPFEDLDELPELDELFGEFGDVLDGAQVTVAGADGVTVIDLGEGDASVTITQEDGEISVSTDGDAEVSDLDELVGGLFGELEGRLGEGGIFDDEFFEDIEGRFLDDEFFEDIEGGIFDDEFFEDIEGRIEPIDLTELRECIDQALDR
ncbi:MAG: hypothetical protein QNJ12_10345 [Ilumatobacter sp.]|uniref:hypothetical protein n=1 Tax=Ilumatobacter sp. TaxID=1967498 RepID=UPI002621A2D4|nr:hypothetical protein [Ilumatobacter sp.]MDJ0769186.1 hypothetical protein [Ilumatobacter sp.]